MSKCQFQVISNLAPGLVNQIVLLLVVVVVNFVTLRQYVLYVQNILKKKRGENCKSCREQSVFLGESGAVGLRTSFSVFWLKAGTQPLALGAQPKHSALLRNSCYTFHNRVSDGQSSVAGMALDTQVQN